MMISQPALLAMSPEQYQRLWRAMFQQEYGDAFCPIDAAGLDALVNDIGFQIYHHQGGSWQVVQNKLRDDLEAAKNFRSGSLRKWIFITSFNFDRENQVNWLYQQQESSRPLEVQVWQQARLDQWTVRYPEIAKAFCGFPPGAATSNSIFNVTGSNSLIFGNHFGNHGKIVSGNIFLGGVTL